MIWLICLFVCFRIPGDDENIDQIWFLSRVWAYKIMSHGTWTVGKPKITWTQTMALTPQKLCKNNSLGGGNSSILTNFHPLPVETIQFD